MLGFLRAGGVNMWFLAAFGSVMVWTAIQFARHADPHRLSILRALTVATVVASIIGFIAGLIATCSAVGTAPNVVAEQLPLLIQGFAESCTNLVFGGAFVVITWVLVAVGVRRMPHDAP